MPTSFRCSTCKQYFPRDQVYVLATKYFRCRSCNTDAQRRYRSTESGREAHKRSVKKWKQENPDKYRAQRRSYSLRALKGNPVFQAKARAYQQAHQNEKRARHAVYIEVRAGRLLKLPCEECGAEKVEAHHPDITKFLEIRWLCKSHHVAVHRQSKAA